MYKELIVDTCREYGLLLHRAAYVIATGHWETNGTFKSVREAYWVKNAEEWRKRNLRYYPYYGRGFPQLTWEENYRKAGVYFGVDLVNQPDLALEPKLSAKILVVGAKEGWFTGKKLSDYIDEFDESAKEDFLEFYHARPVINGMDKANEIAVLAEGYVKWLEDIGYKPLEAPVERSQTASTEPNPINVNRPTSKILTWLVTLLEWFIKVFIKRNVK